MVVLLLSPRDWAWWGIAVSNPHLFWRIHTEMNRANQQLLFQATNQGLLGIRQSEINYFQSLNVAFGTQAALIGGFTYGVFSQNQINHDNGYGFVDVLADVYWICSAITICLSVHVILCTMLMQVLGPGLSLNGPVGSMARATEGMRVEQKQIIVAFIAMMIMFSVSTVLSCWVVMSFEAALGCSAAFAISSCCWYYYCERIYLRFYWEEDGSGWNERNDSMESSEDPVNLTSIAPKDQSIAAAAKLQRQRNGRKGLFSALFRRKGKQPIARQESVMSDRSREDRLSDSGGSNGRANSSGGSRADAVLNKILSADAELEGTEAHTDASGLPVHNRVTSSWLTGNGKKGVVLEGYMTKRGGNTSKRSDYRNEPWERRYFTLSNTCNIFIYKNRNDYRTDAKKPIYTRPLRLQDYYIEVFNMNDPAYNTATIEADPANPYHFQMTLVLREYVDDPAEFNPAVMITATGVSTHPAAAPASAALTTNMQGAPGTANPMSAVLRQAMYRDHWVLQCDTEEELLLWVCTMRELCPSCFKAF
jgi:hypothetical protein